MRLREIKIIMITNIMMNKIIYKIFFIRLNYINFSSQILLINRYYNNNNNNNQQIKASISTH